MRRSNAPRRRDKPVARCHPGRSREYLSIQRRFFAATLVTAPILPYVWTVTWTWAVVSPGVDPAPTEAAMVPIVFLWVLVPSTGRAVPSRPARPDDPGRRGVPVDAGGRAGPGDAGVSARHPDLTGPAGRDAPEQREPRR